MNNAVTPLSAVRFSNFLLYDFFFYNVCSNINYVFHCQRISQPVMIVILIGEKKHENYSLLLFSYNEMKNGILQLHVLLKRSCDVFILFNFTV